MASDAGPQLTGRDAPPDEVYGTTRAGGRVVEPDAPTLAAEHPHDVGLSDDRVGLDGTDGVQFGDSECLAH